ncbi:hypothetical protein CR513_44833, partial [Mucuna pruriens]
MDKITPWFVDIYNFIVASKLPHKHPDYIKKNLKVMLNTTYGMIHTFGDSIVIKSFVDSKTKSVLHFCHSASGGGYYGSTRIARKMFDCGDAHQFVSACKQCQRVGMAIFRDAHQFVPTSNSIL